MGLRIARYHTTSPAHSLTHPRASTRMSALSRSCCLLGSSASIKSCMRRTGAATWAPGALLWDTAQRCPVQAVPGAAAARPPPLSCRGRSPPPTCLQRVGARHTPPIALEGLKLGVSGIAGPPSA